MTIPDEAEIAIVGGGISGTSIAHSLSKRGMDDVIVLEKETLGSGSTGRSAGVIETQFLDEFEIEIRAKSMELFEEIFRDSRAEFHRVGYMRLLTDPDYEETYRKSVEIQTRHGIDDARFIDVSEIEALVPDLNVSDVHGALWGPSDGYADPYTVTQVYAERARERGVAVETGVEVTGVRTKGTAVAGLETTEGTIDCDVVVNAAGPCAPRFAEMVDLDIEAAPYRRQLLVAQPGDGESFGYTVPMVMEYTPAGTKPGLYFRDEGGEQLVMGLHQEASSDEEPTDPNRYKQSYDEELALAVFDLLDHRAPAFTDLDIVDGWAGIYTITPDTKPIIDEHPDLANYFVAAGFSGKGFQVGPMTGEIMADLILGDTPPVMDDISPVRLNRFE